MSGMVEVTTESLQHLSKSIKKKIREYYQQFYVHKLNNLDKVDKCLDRHKLPKLSPEELGNLSRPPSIREIEFVVENLASKKTLGPGDFTRKFF